MAQGEDLMTRPREARGPARQAWQQQRTLGWTGAAAEVKTQSERAEKLVNSDETKSVASPLGWAGCGGAAGTPGLVEWPESCCRVAWDLPCLAAVCRPRLCKHAHLSPLHLLLLRWLNQQQLVQLQPAWRQQVLPLLATCSSSRAPTMSAGWAACRATTLRRGRRAVPPPRLCRLQIRSTAR